MGGIAIKQSNYSEWSENSFLKKTNRNESGLLMEETVQQENCGEV